MHGLSRTDLLARLAAVRRALPVPDGYPARGRARPSERVAQFARRAGWPVARVFAGEGVPPVAVVPRAWLEEFARRLGCDLADVCRGLVPDEG